MALSRLRETRPLNRHFLDEAFNQSEVAAHVAEEREHDQEPVDEAENSQLLNAVSDALHRNAVDEVRTLVGDLRAPDLAAVIELLAPNERVELIQALGSSFDYEVLSEIDEGVRDQLSEALPNDLLAKAVTELDTDDAAYLIENLEESDQQEILAQLPSEDREAD